MTEEEFQEYLIEVFDGFYDLEQLAEQVKHCKTFKEASLLTYNKGIVITLSDGSRFQLTINKER